MRPRPLLLAAFATGAANRIVLPITAEVSKIIESCSNPCGASVAGGVRDGCLPCSGTLFENCFPYLDVIAIGISLAIALKKAPSTSSSFRTVAFVQAALYIFSINSRGAALLAHHCLFVVVASLQPALLASRLMLLVADSKQTKRPVAAERGSRRSWDWFGVVYSSRQVPPPNPTHLDTGQSCEVLVLFILTYIRPKEFAGSVVLLVQLGIRVY